MMRKPIKTTEYRKMPAVRGFYGFKRKTLWRRYRFSLPFFFFFCFSFYLSHTPPADELENIIKRGQCSLLLLLARIAWIENAIIFAIQDDANLRKKKDVLTIKNCSRSNTLYVIIEILFIFFLFFSEFRIKIRLREEISAMLWLFN